MSKSLESHPARIPNSFISGSKMEIDLVIIILDYWFELRETKF